MTNEGFSWKLTIQHGKGTLMLSNQLLRRTSLERFEKLTNGVNRVYKNILKIKKSRMDSIGLKGTHVMCLHYLSISEDGLTATQLCERCYEDKAGISRILSELEEKELIFFEQNHVGKRYRTKACLSEKGRETAKSVAGFIEEATKAAGKGISDEERKIFYKVLNRIADNLTDVCRNLAN